MEVGEYNDAVDVWVVRGATGRDKQVARKGFFVDRKSKSRCKK